MEDALISPVGFAILSGAGIVDASEVENGIIQHVTETVVVGEDGLKVSAKPHVVTGEHTIYVMKLDRHGDTASEPYIYTFAGGEAGEDGKFTITVLGTNYKADSSAPKAGDTVLVDYYTAKASGMQQIEITAEKFGGNFYLEASTLFRNQDGVDLPAEFIIPNCKVQSNFTFTMASSGDPSTFTFTMDAFPDYTRWDTTQKVLCAIQIVSEDEENDEDKRTQTDAHATIA